MFLFYHVADIRKPSINFPIELFDCNHEFSHHLCYHITSSATYMYMLTD